MTERLTTLAAVKDWLDITTEDSDTSLLRLIDAASRFVLGWLNRDSFQERTYTQNFKGNGKAQALLANWPVISITSVGVGGVEVPASVEGQSGLPGSGYRLSDPRNTYRSVELFGYGFTMNAPVQVTYTSGFTAVEDVTLPQAAEGKVTYTPNGKGQWTLDRGVKVDGVTLTLTTDETPATGEYFVDDWGTYVFNEDTAGKAASFSYDYVPFDVSFAVTEMIGEWYKRKDRIGLLSKTLGGQETVTFSQKDMGDAIKTALQTYKNVVPI